MRIDLRRYRWTDSSWSLLTDVYPFGVFQGSDAEKKCRDWTKSPLPLTVHIDGEFFARPEDEVRDLKINLLPRALRVKLTLGSA